MTDGGHEDRRVTSEELSQMTVDAFSGVVDLSDEGRAEVLRVARDELAKAWEQMDEMPLASTVADAMEAVGDAQEAAADDDGEAT
jgi:hypothetical protein